MARASLDDPVEIVEKEVRIRREIKLSILKSRRDCSESVRRNIKNLSLEELIG